MITERKKKLATKYEEMLNLGMDSGMRVSLQWADCERTIHSWEALAALMGKQATTLRSYRSRDQLHNVQAKHPDYPHQFADCHVEVYQEAKRGPTGDPEKRAADIALRRRKAEAKIAKLKIDLTLAEAKLLAIK